MSYSDDSIRAQRRTLPKSKIGMSENEMLKQKAMLQKMVEDNKRVVEKGTAAEEEKAQTILHEGLKRFERVTGINQADADKKMQEVVDYFQS